MAVCKLGHIYNYELSKMKSGIKIRDYKPNDFDEIQNLWNLTGLGGKERKDDDEVISRSLSGGGRFLVMEKNSKIIGTVWLTHDFRRTYLHHFGIHPDFQGLGLANKLMDETMKLIKEIGFQVKLEVHKENSKAANLYRKYAFEDFSDYELMISRKINI
ncbi:MAG: GNAT family N-acetyltransferase [Bacteroidales bacterium]|nr:GNAT family N-acetyltransferase [Bacteroidales bacterium]